MARSRSLTSVAPVSALLPARVLWGGLSLPAVPAHVESLSISQPELYTSPTEGSGVTSPPLRAARSMMTTTNSPESPLQKEAVSSPPIQARFTGQQATPV